MSKVKWSLGFEIDRKSMANLDRSLEEARKKASEEALRLGVALDSDSWKKFENQINALESALVKNFNKNLGKLDAKGVLNDLKEYGYSLNDLRRSFLEFGGDANRALGSVEKQMKYSALSIKQTNKVLDEMATTFKNTLKWYVASGALHQIEGSVGRAVGYVKALDESLNNIRVVTSQSSEEMAAFAIHANNAAKALGRTTVDYTDASLIYFQQGKTKSEVEQLTRATLIGSNITGQEVAETAELMTASLNGFNLEANSAMEIMDKFAAVGASTGSSFEELAKGFSKVASMAKSAGVEVDQLNGMLSTISTVTREAPEAIGTSLKTIFGRIAEVKAGKADEDGWTLGQVEAAFNKVNMSVLDKVTGQMKDTGIIIEEVGEKWGTFNKETQMALSTAMAGNRQQNRLLALFNNWDMYTSGKDVSKGAEGSAMQQNLVRMDALTYKTKELRAELESLWSKMLNSDALKSMVDLLTKATEQLNKMIENGGGFYNILFKMSMLVGQVFSSQLAGGLTNMKNSVAEGWKNLVEYRKASQGLDNDSKNFRRDEYNIHRMLGEEKHAAYVKLAEEYTIQEKLKITAEAKLKTEILQNEERRKAAELERQAAEESLRQLKAEQETLIVLKEATNTALTQAQQNEQLLQSYNSSSVDVASKGPILAKSAKTRLLNNGLDSQVVDDLLSPFQNQKVTSQLLAQRLSELQVSANTTTAGYANVIAGHDDKLKELPGKMTEAEAKIKSADRAIDKATDKIKSLTSAEGNATSAVSKHNEQMDALRNKMQDMADEADKMKRSKMAISAIFGGAAVVQDTIRLIQKLNNEALTPAQKATEIASTTFSRLGTILTILPVPGAAVVGTLMQLAGSIIPLIDLEDEFTKSMKRNEEAIRSYRIEVDKLNQKINGLSALKNNYIKFQELVLGQGITPEMMTQEDQNAYYNMNQQLSEIFPELIKYYDDQGRAIVNLKNSIEDLIEAQRVLVRTQNDLMVNKSDSFISEYTQRRNKAEQSLAENILKVQRLEEERQLQFKRGDDKGVAKLDKELAKANSEISKLQQELGDIKISINANVVTPFMQANNEIGKLDENSRKVISTLWNVDSVTKSMKDLKEMESLKEKSLNAAVILDMMKNTGATDSLKSLQGMAAATQQAIIESVMSLPLGFEQSSQAIDKVMKAMISNKDEYLKRPLKPQDIIPLSEVEQKQYLSYLQDQSALMQKLSSDFKKITSAGRNNIGLQVRYDNFKQEDLDVLKQAGFDTSVFKEVNGTYSFSDETMSAQEYTKSILDLQEALAKNAEGYKNNASEMNAIINGTGPEYVKINKQLSDAFYMQAYEMANTVTGYNALVDSYDEQSKSLGDLIDKYDEIDESAIGFMEDIMSMDSDLRSPIDGMAEAFQNLGNVLKDLPLQQLLTQFPELASAVTDVTKNGANASQDSITQVYSALSTAKSGMSAMFLALNKDSEDYYKQFQQVNAKQINEVYAKTGIMAENYKTYAEYEEAINKQKIETIAANDEEFFETKIGKLVQESNVHAEEARNRVANEIKEAQTSLDNNKTSVEAYKQLQVAKSKAAILEQLVSEKQQIASNIRILSSMRETLDKASWGISKIFNIGKGALFNQVNDELTLLEAKLKAYDKEISAVADGTAKYTGSADKNSTDLGVPEFNEFKFDYGVSNTGGYKGLTSPQKKNYPTVTEKEGPMVNPDAGKSGKAKDMDFDPDYLHDTDVLLKEISNALDELRNKLKDAFGEEKLRLLQEQSALLKQQKDIYQQQLIILEEQAKVKKSELLAEGVQFDEQGRILNYNDIIQQKVNAANSITDSEAKQAAIDDVKEFMENLKQYEQFNLAVKIDKEKAIRETEDTIHALDLEQFEFTINLQMKIFEDRDKDLEFLNSIRAEFEEVSEIYSTTMDQLENTSNEIAEIEGHIKEIQFAPGLSTAERVKMLEEWNDKLRSATKRAVDLRKELVEINEKALKQGLELLNQHINKFEGIDNQLEHITNMLKLLGKSEDYQKMAEIYNAQTDSLNAQLDALLAARQSMVNYVSQLKEGSKEWEYANSQLMQMEDKINNLTEKTLKSFQEQLKNSVGGILKELDKKLTGGLGTDEASRRWEKMKKDQEKYLSLQEKIVWSGQMQAKVQKQIESSTNPKTKEALQKFLDRELTSLKEKDKLSQYDVERAEKIYDITQKQIALDEARNNKTIMRLVRDSLGNWSYQYVEDTEKVAQAQEDLSKSLKDLMEFDKKQFIKNQDEMIAAKEEFNRRIQEIMEKALNGQYATQQEFNDALNLAQREFNTEMELLHGENSDIMKNISESTLAAILDTYAINQNELGILTKDQEKMLKELGLEVGNQWDKIRSLLHIINTDNANGFREKFVNVVGNDSYAMFVGLQSIFNNISSEWDNSVTELIQGNTNFKVDVENAMVKIKSEWQNYQDKVKDVTVRTGESVEELMKKAKDLAAETENLGKKTEEVIRKIDTEWSAVSNLINIYQGLDAQYGTMITRTQQYIGYLDKMIDKANQAASAAANAIALMAAASAMAGGGGQVNIPTIPTPPPSSSGGGSSSKPRTAVVASDASAYLDSYGTQVLPWSEQARAAGISYGTELYVVGENNGKVALSKTPYISDAIAWLDKSSLRSFDTGGYTGEFGKEGRLALLHEKELVLNKEDTKNVLDIVSIVRDYGSALRKLIGRGTQFMANSDHGDIQQSVVINADFSGVKKSYEIENAFTNLTNRAAQYAFRKK